MISFVNLNVRDILKERKNESSASCHQEVNIFDIISFVINILVEAEPLWFKKWTHPRYERGLVFVQEEFNILISLFIDINRDFNLQLMG